MFSSSSFRSCVWHYRAAAAEEEKKSSTLTARCVKDDRGGTKKRNWRALYGQKRTGGRRRRGHQYVSWFTMTQDSRTNQKKEIEEDYLISYY
jgi:hypothetical protein